MKKLSSRLANNQGVTLVELLATIIIVSIVATLTYTILFQGYSNYQRVKVEAELRDEADLIMASLVKDIFTLKKSEVQLVQSCTNGMANSYLNVTQTSPVTGVKATPYKTGLDSGKVIAKGYQIQTSSDNIELLSSACTPTSPKFISQSANGAEFIIKFSLKTKNSKKQLHIDFTNTVTIIDDTKGGAENAAN